MPITSENKRIPQREKRDHLEWQHTARFVKEVERLEAEGRVESRTDLEQRLLLPYGAITSMRGGRFRVSSSAIELLKREYNGDFQYIIMGVRDPEVSSWLRAGRDLRLGADGKPRKGYQYKYQNPAADLAALSGLPVLPREDS